MKTLYHASREQQLADLVAMELLCSAILGKLMKMQSEHSSSATTYSAKAISRLHKVLYIAHKECLAIKPIRSMSKKYMKPDITPTFGGTNCDLSGIPTT